MISRRRAMRFRRPPDQNTMAESVSTPGIDPRQWVSIGVVTLGEDPPVEFSEELGQPLVNVTLQPSMVPVRCRVSSMIAGNGEGSWHPFLQGDEVVVVVPEGREDSGCVIIGRLNNAIDKFPMSSVAGQDPTTNSFGFERRRTPFVMEYAGPIFLRSALSSAIIGIAADGSITIKDGENAAIQLGQDAISIMGPSSTTSPPKMMLQFGISSENFTVQMGDAILNLSSSSGSPQLNTISVPGAMTIGTIGNPPLEHVSTTESAANVLTQVLVSLAANLTTVVGAVPQTGVTLGAAITAWLALPVTSASPAYAQAWPLAAVTPLGVPSATLPLAIAGAFAAALPKPPGVLQLMPGIGTPGLLVG